jgi:hypothetical protein
VLSHGAFIGASIGSSAVAVSLLTLRYVLRDFYPADLRVLGMGWNFASLIISIWTVYAIFKTWNTADNFIEQIFTDEGFMFLLFVTGSIAAFNIWTLVLVSKPLTRKQKQSQHVFYDP